MKPFVPVLTAAILSAAGLNACGQPENKNMSIQEQTEQRFRQNPNPKEAYRIRLKINDAPGPLKLMGDMTVGYQADNCEYLITSEIIGAKAHPEKTLKTPIRQIGENEYETVVYRDAMLDEDYFGDGVCRWRVVGFGTGFKATGKPEETRFSFGDMVDELIKQKTMTSYYWKRDYPYTKKDDGSIYEDSVHFAIRSPETLNPEEFKNLFSITATIEEVK